MSSDLNKLRIDKSRKPSAGPARRPGRWVLAGVLLIALLGIANLVYSKWTATIEVEIQRVRPIRTSAAAAGRRVILNATGYIIAAHKIELASKVVGRVKWIGVDKGDKVTKGQPIVRLEDDEYRAQLQQAQGRLVSLQAKLRELENGSRPEEIAVAKANLDQAKADLANARVSLGRTRRLTAEGVLSRQALDNAQALFNARQARVRSLDRTLELMRIGPRQEEIDAAKGQIEEAAGAVAFYRTQLLNTVIRAPINGTILEREVEIGEYVTTSFVGERGAKGYVVSLADLDDLQVELDINQNDFARLGPHQPCIVTTDAYPDREYKGVIEEISPEANRQKATVQVKVKILKPDSFLRPEMNASVAFYAEGGTGRGAPSRSAAVIFVPTGAVRNGSVFVFHDGRAVERKVRTGNVTNQGIRIEDGLFGGEDLILDPPPKLKDGTRVRPKQGETS